MIQKLAAEAMASPNPRMTIFQGSLIEFFPPVVTCPADAPSGLPANRTRHRVVRSPVGGRCRPQARVGCEPVPAKYLNTHAFPITVSLIEPQATRHLIDAQLTQQHRVDTRSGDSAVRQLHAGLQSASF
jgi:hypothetical protein